MTAMCADCGHSELSDNHRGARLGDCPECGGQMRAHRGESQRPVPVPAVPVDRHARHNRRATRSADAGRARGPRARARTRAMGAGVAGGRRRPRIRTRLRRHLSPGPGQTEPERMDQGHPRTGTKYRSGRLDREREARLQAVPGMRQPGRRHRADGDGRGLVTPTDARVAPGPPSRRHESRPPPGRDGRMPRLRPTPARSGTVLMTSRNPRPGAISAPGSWPTTWTRSPGR